jgi:hypothetical protein
MRKLFKSTVIFTDGRMEERLFLDRHLAFATAWARGFYAYDAYTSITVESMS